MIELKMMQKVKVRSGLLVGLIGRIIQFDHSWPAPYGIRYEKVTFWFYAEELEIATAEEIITQGKIGKHELADSFTLIRDRQMCSDGTYK